MYIIYTDESILEVPDPKKINKDIKDIKSAKLNITDEGDIQDFLGVNIYRKPNGTIQLIQPYLIDQILDEFKMGEKTEPKDTPASS